MFLTDSLGQEFESESAVRVWLGVSHKWSGCQLGLQLSGEAWTQLDWSWRICFKSSSSCGYQIKSWLLVRGLSSSPVLHRAAWVSLITHQLVLPETSDQKDSNKAERPSLISCLRAHILYFCRKQEVLLSFLPLSFPIRKTKVSTN